MSPETTRIVIIVSCLAAWTCLSGFFITVFQAHRNSTVNSGLGSVPRHGQWSKFKRRIRWIVNCLKTAVQPPQGKNLEEAAIWALDWLTKAFGTVHDNWTEFRFGNSTNAQPDATNESVLSQIKGLGAFEVIRTTFNAQTSDYNWNWTTDTSLQSQVNFHRSINLKVAGIAITVSAQKINEVPVVRFESTWIDHDYRMAIFEETVSEDKKVLLGMQDIVVNDPDGELNQTQTDEFGNHFDATYIVQSNDERVLKGLLSSDAQRDLLSLGSDISFNVVGGAATLEVRQEFEAPHHGRKICEITSNFASLLKHLGDADGKLMFQEMGVSTRECSTCLVCGEEIEEAPVYCRSCQTPHHADCWQYLGKCSTYACGELWCDH